MRHSSVAIFVGFLILGLSGIAQTAEPNLVRDWEYYWPETEGELDFESVAWNPLPPNLIAPDRNGRTRLWLKTEVDPAQGDLYLPGVFMLFTVYADGQVIYQFDDLLGAGSTPWHLVPLSDLQRTELTALVLDIDSSYSRIGFMSLPSQGEDADIVESIVRQDFGRLGLSFFYVFLGLVAVMMAFVKRDLAFAAFGALAISMAGYGLRYTQSRQFIEPDPVFWFYVWSTSLIVAMPAFLVFYLIVFPTASQLLNSLLKVNLLVSGAGLLLTFLAIAGVDWPTLGNAFTTGFRLLLVLSLIIVVANSALIWFRGSREAGILLVGIIASLTLSSMDVLYALGLLLLEAPVMHWGTFTFILTLLIVLAIRYAETERKIEQQALKLAENTREKSLFIADLHDGIGAITSNISMLANTDSDQSDEILGRIHHLASKGQDEIRSFMYSLDEDSEKLSALVADMRRYGVDLLDSNNIKLDFNASANVDSISVSSYTNLNLFRIYKESLQNVISHANATSVSVDIELEGQFLVLQISDNGTGIDPSDSRTNSRGITGMQQRVRKLDGKFSLLSEQGVSVRIEIPISRDDEK